MNPQMNPFLLARSIKIPPKKNLKIIFELLGVQGLNGRQKNVLPTAPMSLTPE